MGALAKMKVVAQGDVDTLNLMRRTVDSNAGGLFSRTDVAAAISYAKAVGVNVETASELVPLLRDTAAIYNEDLLTAMQAVTRAALFGEAELAERIGLALRENAIMGTTMALYGKRLSQLTQEEKIIAVVTAAKEQLARVTGGEAEKLGTMSGATKELTVALKELSTEALMPALGPLTDFVRLLADGAREARSFGDNINDMRSGRGGFLGQIDKAVVEQMGGGIPGMIFALQDLLSKPDIKKILDQYGGYTGTAAGVFTPGGSLLRAGTAGAETAGESAYDKWLEGFLKKAAEDRQVQEFMSRYLREQVGGALDVEPGNVGERTFGVAEESATEMLVRQARERAEIMYEIHAEEAERERYLWESSLAAHLELAKTFENAMVSGWDAMYGAMNQAGTLFWNRENRRGRAMTHLAKYVAKETAAAVVEGLGMQAKQYAGVAMAHAAYFAAHGNFASAAAMVANAAQWAAIAGTTAVAAGAIRGGAQRELSAIGAMTEPAAGEIRSTAGGSSSITGRSDISAMIAKAPEVVNINVTTILEGPNVIGADAAALRVFYDDHIREWVADDARSGELAAA